MRYGRIYEYVLYEGITVKRLVIALSLSVIGCECAQTAPLVHIVIAEEAFSEHLSHGGAIAVVPDGTLMRISFDYSEYDPLHPYLLANQYCGDNQFLQWGTASHPSLGEIDLICVRGSVANTQSLSVAGN